MIADTPRLPAMTCTSPPNAVPKVEAMPAPLPSESVLAATKKMPGPGIAAMISAASRNSEKFAPLISMRPRQTKRHHLLECGLHRGSGKQRQRIDRHRAVVLGAVEGILERAVLGHQADGVVEIAVGDLAPLQRVDPEGALAVVAAAERQRHRQRDLVLAEIVADDLVELGGVRVIVLTHN